MSIENRSRFKEADNSLVPWTYGSEKSKRYAGTEDWVLVTIAEEDAVSYEWDEIRVFYSPAARRYFWHSDNGCSCNMWEGGVASNFEDGDKQAAIKAVDEWTMRWSDTPHKDKIGPADRAKSEIRDFDRTEAAK